MSGKWVEFGLSSAPQIVSVVAALLTKNYINTLSGCLMGSQMMVSVITKYISLLLRKLTARVDNALVHRAAVGFDPSHPAVGVASVAIAIGAFASQQRQTPKLTFPMKLVRYLC